MSLAPCVLVLAAALAVAVAQDGLYSRPAPGGSRGDIRVETSLVFVPVSVTDAAGRPVEGLAASDFSLYEDGQVQQLARVTRPGRAAIDLALVLDVSGSMQARFPFARQAAAAFTRRMAHLGDTVTLWTVGATPTLSAGPTSDVDGMISTLTGLSGAAGTTALFDTTADAADSLGHPIRPATLRILILLSDGQDNNSTRQGLSGAVARLQRTDCVLYAINSAGASSGFNETGRRGVRALEALASGTGGLVFAPDRQEDLRAVFDRIAADIESRYLLEYYAPGTAGIDGFHEIRVEVAGRPELQVRSRRGYRAR